MIISTKKGSVIIVALMISTILGLITTGLYVVFVNNTNGANSQVNKSKLFWAAEAGSNFLAKKLMCETYGVFIDSTKAKAVVDANNYKKTLTIDGITVNVLAEVKADATSGTNWKLISTASGAAGNCTVTIDNIKPQTNLDNAAFFGGKSNAGYDYKFRYFGKVYFNDEQKIIWTPGKGGPKFYGLVESGSNMTSFGQSSGSGTWTADGWSGLSDNGKLRPYLTGSNFEKGLAEINSPNDANSTAAINRFKEIFKSSKNDGEGYKTNSNPINIKDLADAWNNIRTDSKTLAVASPAGASLGLMGSGNPCVDKKGEDVKIVYEVVGGETYANFYVKNAGDKTKNRTVETQNQWERMKTWVKMDLQGDPAGGRFMVENTPKDLNGIDGTVKIKDGQTIFIHGMGNESDGITPKNGDVYVSGVTNKTVSLVTKRATVMIDGDLYVDGLKNSGINNKKFQDLTDAEILEDNDFESASAKLQQEIAKSKVKIGVVAGQGAGGEGGDPTHNQSNDSHKSDIMLYPSAANKNGTILFTTAALHTPAGRIKTYNKSGNISASWNDISEWPTLTTWMNAGCMAVKYQGQVADTNNGKGFNMAMIGDPRYMVMGDRPPGFMYGVNRDPKRGNGYVMNKISSACRWSIKWN